MKPVYIYKTSLGFYSFVYELEGKVYEYSRPNGAVSGRHLLSYDLPDEAIFHDVEKFKTWYRKSCQKYTSTFIGETRLIYGCYFPRISWEGNAKIWIDEESALRDFEASNLLMEKLKKIFMTVYPSKENSTVYGHEIRSVLLLICMEIESNFVAVLKKNGLHKDRYTTSDFIRLKDVMDLEEYEASLKYFPGYSSIAPFKGWKEESSTKSLSWYSSYNETKHNREAAFSEGSLANAIEAISALAILLHAQYHYLPLGNDLSPLHNRIDYYTIRDIDVRKSIEVPTHVYLPTPAADTPDTFVEAKYFESN